MQVGVAGDMPHLVEPLFRVPDLVSCLFWPTIGFLSLRDQKLVDELKSR